jgi:hypothetical protein
MFFSLSLSFLQGVNQDFSKNFVRITIKIPKMKTGINWRKLKRESKNGITTEATYHGKYVKISLSFNLNPKIFLCFSRLNFEFILNRGKTTETKYGFATREPLHGPIEYNKSYLTVNTFSFPSNKIRTYISILV